MHMEKSAFADSALNNVPRRSFAQLYRSDTVNHCPACGHTHWHVGRSTAECAFCDTALPLAASKSQPNEPIFWYRGSSTAAALAA